MEKEIQYLESLIIDLNELIGDGKLIYSEDKVVFGLMENNQSELGKYYSQLTLIDSAKRLSLKIKISLLFALKYSYSDEVQQNFTSFSANTNEMDAEFLAYYYIENALFRNVILWDTLAQIYNIEFDLKTPPDKIHYAKFFKKHTTLGKVSDIIKYLDESKEDKCEEFFLKGNHIFLTEYRNQMTHRNSPDLGSLSNFDMNFKSHPSYILRRLCEDYNKVANFLVSIINEVRKEF